MLRNLLAILRSWYRLIFKRQEDARTREIVDTLRRVPLFQGLSRMALYELADAMHIRSYKREEVLYYEGDPGLGMYVVQQGRIRLVAEDDQGSEHELRQVEDHELFGVLSVFGDFRRMETAQAMTEARVLGFFRPDLKTMIKRNPRTGAHVIAALARNMAAWQVEMVQRVGEQRDTIYARTILHGAARKLRSYDPDLPQQIDSR
jgi:CRP-like cAMP-binding protein